MRCHPNEDSRARKTWGCVRRPPRGPPASHRHPQKAKHPPNGRPRPGGCFGAAPRMPPVALGDEDGGGSPPPPTGGGHDDPPPPDPVSGAQPSAEIPFGVTRPGELFVQPPAQSPRRGHKRDDVLRPQLVNRPKKPASRPLGSRGGGTRQKTLDTPPPSLPPLRSLRRQPPPPHGVTPISGDTGVRHPQPGPQHPPPPLREGAPPPNQARGVTKILHPLAMANHKPPARSSPPQQRAAPKLPQSSKSGGGGEVWPPPQHPKSPLGPRQERRSWGGFQRGACQC